MLRVLKLTCLVSGIMLMVISLTMWRTQASHSDKLDVMVTSLSKNEVVAIAPHFKYPVEHIGTQVGLVGAEGDWLYFYDPLGNVFGVESVFRVSLTRHHREKLFDVSAHAYSLGVTWTADKQWFVYLNSLGVFRVRPNGQDRKNLTTALPGKIRHIHLSTDSQWVYVMVGFFSDTTGSFQAQSRFFRIKLEDGQIEELTPNFANILEGDFNYLVDGLSNGDLLLIRPRQTAYVLRPDGQVITQLSLQPGDRILNYMLMKNRGLLLVEVTNSEAKYNGFRVFDILTGELLWESSDLQFLVAVALGETWLYVSDDQRNVIPVRWDGTPATSADLLLWEGAALGKLGRQVLCDSIYYCGAVFGSISDEVRFPATFHLPSNLHYERTSPHWFISGNWIYIGLFDSENNVSNYYRFRPDGSRFEQFTYTNNVGGMPITLTRWRFPDWNKLIVVVLGPVLCLIGMWRPPPSRLTAC